MNERDLRTEPVPNSEELVRVLCDPFLTYDEAAVEAAVVTPTDGLRFPDRSSRRRSSGSSENARASASSAERRLG